MHATSCLNPIMTWKSTNFELKTLLHTEERGSPVLRVIVVLSRDLAVLDCDLRPAGQFWCLEEAQVGIENKYHVFLFSGPYLPERHVGSCSHCANQHFIYQYSKCIKKIFPREGSACHIFFHKTRVQNTQTHKIITGLMKPAFCIYTISHTLVFVKN